MGAIYKCLTLKFRNLVMVFGFLKILADLSILQAYKSFKMPNSGQNVNVLNFYRNIRKRSVPFSNLNIDIKIHICENKSMEMKLSISLWRKL